MFDIIAEDNKQEFEIYGKKEEIEPEEEEKWDLQIENPNSVNYICSEQPKRWKDLKTGSKKINYYGKTKKICQKRVRSLVITGKKKEDWNKANIKQRGVKLFFCSKKDWDLDITKASSLYFEQEDDGIILNDDYNSIKETNLLMRPVQATILKVHDEDSNSSVSSYDFLQYVQTKFMAGKECQVKLDEDDVYQSVVNRTKVVNSYNQNKQILKENVYNVVEENTPIIFNNDYNTNNLKNSEKVVEQEKITLSGSEAFKAKIDNNVFDYARVFPEMNTAGNQGGVKIVIKEEQAKEVKKVLDSRKKNKKIDLFGDTDSEDKNYLKI